MAVSGASLFASGQNNLEDSDREEEVGKGVLTLPDLDGKGAAAAAAAAGGGGVSAPAASAPVPARAPTPARAPAPAPAPAAGGGTGEGNGGGNSFRSIFSAFGRDSSRSSIFPSSKTHKRVSGPNTVCNPVTAESRGRGSGKSSVGPIFFAPRRRRHHRRRRCCCGCCC